MSVPGPCVFLPHGWKLPQGRKSCCCHRGGDRAWQEQGTPQCGPDPGYFPLGWHWRCCGLGAARALNRAGSGEVRLGMEMRWVRDGPGRVRQRRGRAALRPAQPEGAPRPGQGRGWQGRKVRSTAGAPPLPSGVEPPWGGGASPEGVRQAWG